jgi:molybdopterin-binding protein
MRLSARNQIKGTVLDVKKGATTAHVRVDNATPTKVASAIGSPQASSVSTCTICVRRSRGPGLSDAAPNIAWCRFLFGGGQTMLSSITNEAVDELGIKINDSVTRSDQGLRRHDCGGLSSHPQALRRQRMSSATPPSAA